MAVQPPAPEEGDVRINDDVLEYYVDGAWVPQEELPDVESPPVMRGEAGPQIS
ncbi:hypothetical protein [Actinomadura sp. 6K520]|uniref:hypothetical protein n=1 Tax=Actinomadura sp. 6K520 TaxID=2530364 RepID=UPI001404838A|nr:hypothetical protein [Actinomadura sp. 6K520]